MTSRVKPYKFIRFGDIQGPKHYKSIGFGDIQGPKPYKFIGFGDIQDPKPYKCIGFGDILGFYRSVWKLKCTFVFSVLGQIPTELYPETRSNGSGLKNGAERDQN